MNLPEKRILDSNETQQVFDTIDSYTVQLDAVDYSEHLFQGYKRIVIVGLQRSGTTFTSQALCNTLGFTNVDEGEFGVRNVMQFKEIMKRKNIVIQAPAMGCRIQTLVGNDDLVVFMTRKWSDIVKSVYKKNGKISTWVLMNTMYDIEKYYFMEYDKNIEPIYDKFVDRNSYYLDAYYKMWKHYQSKIIPNCIALNYESMKSHPMWIDKNKRKAFHEKQTTL